MTTAIDGLAGSPQPRLAATRASLHRVAEHVLAPAVYAATGHISLRPAPGGFRTPEFGPDARVIAVDGDQLVVAAAGRERRATLTTVRDAAAFVGVTPGAPVEVYTPATPLVPDERLEIDARTARLLGDWYLLGAEALSRFAAEFPDDEPSPPRLWPEHFDLGITAGRINYGASPGDDDVAAPYLYVAPRGGPPPGEPAFWNAQFGATRTTKQIRSPDDAVAFFRAGRERALAHDSADQAGRKS